FRRVDRLRRIGPGAGRGAGKIDIAASDTLKLWNFPLRGRSALAFVEGCKLELEISIPVEAFEAETGKVAKTYQDKVKLPAFRPGKAPASLIRRNFAGDIRQQVLERLVPRFFEAKAKEENLRVVGTPNISDVHFHEGEPVRFKAQFEVY